MPGNVLAVSGRSVNVLIDRRSASLGDHDHEGHPGDKRSRQGPARIWNPRTDWVICEELTHAPLVSDDDFLAVQQITALGVLVAGPSDRGARRSGCRPGAGG
jgi:hypothetical protein